MAAPKKPFNPFYAGLVVVGTVFAISACAYGVMTVRMLRPQVGDEQGIIQFLDDFGVVILVAELGLLGILTFAAMATDDYWSRHAAASRPADRKED